MPLGSGARCDTIDAVPHPDCPFFLVLRHAADRFYTAHQSLASALDRDAAAALHRLSVAPECFGTIRTFHGVEHRRKAHQDVLTAARAYIVGRRKAEAHKVEQGELPLT